MFATYWDHLQFIFSASFCVGEKILVSPNLGIGRKSPVAVPGFFVSIVVRVAPPP